MNARKREPRHTGGKEIHGQLVRCLSALPVLLAVVATLVGMSSASLARAGSTPSGYLLVSSWDTNSVLRYDAATGAFVDTFIPTKTTGLRQPAGIVFGPDNNLYVGSGWEYNTGTGHKQIMRFDGISGAFENVFADQNLLQSPRAILFGPDGNLYEADGYSGTTDRVRRFNGSTGIYMDDFVPAAYGGIANPTGMVFGPDGENDGKLDLYVACVFNNTVLRYDGTTGAFRGVFVPAGSGGLSNPEGIVFGPDGNLYVASSNLFASSNPSLGSILCYEGPGGPQPGAFLGAFVAPGAGGLSNPIGILFGPGRDLYVTTAVYFNGNQGGVKNFDAVPGTSGVLRYDGRTGAFRGAFVSPDSGGLKFPIFLTFTATDPTTLNYTGP